MSTPTGFRIVAATANPDKLARIRQIVGPGFHLVPMPPDVAVEEPPGDDALAGAGEALVRIAAAKALSACLALGGDLTIATDGGLVIPALGEGWRPAMTRRFAGPHATNRQRAEAVVALAATLTGTDRRIVWREAVAVARHGRIVLSAVAASRPGSLATDPGDWADAGQGFWVPRLWRPDPDPERSPSTGEEHWARLTAIVGPFLAGFNG